MPNRPATTTVTTGPYRWTRNPMYVSLICLYVACGLVIDTWWALVFLIPVVLIIAEYAAYAARVRRWL